MIETLPPNAAIGDVPSGTGRVIKNAFRHDFEVGFDGDRLIYRLAFHYRDAQNNDRIQVADIDETGTFCDESPWLSTERLLTGDANVGKQFQPALDYQFKLPAGSEPTPNPRLEWQLAYLSTTFVVDPTGPYVAPWGTTIDRRLVGNDVEVPAFTGFHPLTPLVPLPDGFGIDWYACPRGDGYWGDYFGVTQLYNPVFVVPLLGIGGWHNVAVFTQSAPLTPTASVSGKRPSSAPRSISPATPGSARISRRSFHRLHRDAVSKGLRLSPALLWFALTSSAVSCGARSGVLEGGGAYGQRGGTTSAGGGGSSGNDASTSGIGGSVAGSSGEGGTAGTRAGSGGASGSGGFGGVGGNVIPPSSCNDVGKLPGSSQCCGGEYCAGTCPFGGCMCGTVAGGCIWPEVCCKGGCVGPYNAGCDGAWPFDAGKPTLVHEPEDCLPPLDKKKHPQVRRSCCNGKLCEGLCFLFPDKEKPECWCDSLPGGCPSPHVCCGTTCSALSSCQYSDP